MYFTEKRRRRRGFLGRDAGGIGEHRSLTATQLTDGSDAHAVRGGSAGPGKSRVTARGGPYPTYYAYPQERYPTISLYDMVRGSWEPNPSDSLTLEHPRTPCRAERAHA
jgi:hypothetical protein